MTSLSRQLKQLAAPQTSLLKLDKKKPSLLFDPREAANLDRDAVYEIGLSGLEDLEKIDSRFTEFRNSLFSLASKGFERAVQTAEVNEKVDKHIEEFLVLVSPYFTLKSAQKSLEWLVNRYHVHQFNVNAWIMCILPFHDTKIFVRALQLVSLKNETDQWHWLHPLQKPGIPLPKHTLLNRCAIDAGLLKHICTTLQKAITVHSDKPSVLNVFVAFYTTSVVGMLELSKKVTEEQLATLLTTLLNGLSSKFPDLVAGCYMIVAQLTRKAKLTAKVALEFIASIFKGLSPALVIEAVTLMILLCNNQDSPLLLVPQFRKHSKLLAEHMELVRVIGTLSSNFEVSPFVCTLINAFLHEIAHGSEQKLHSDFLRKLVEDVRFTGADPGKIIREFFTGYVKASEQGKPNQSALDATVKEIITRLETQYPIDFERSLHEILSDNTYLEARKEMVRRILGDHWDVDHTKLFMQLNHTSDSVRADAVASIVKAVKEDKVKNMAVTLPMLIERLSDSSPLVVNQVLRLEEKLLDILPAENQFSLLLNVLNGNKIAANVEDWKEIRMVLVKLMCGPKYLEGLNNDQLAEVFLSMLPFVLPLDASDFAVATTVLRSALITYSPMLKLLSEKFRQVESNRKEPPANAVHVIIGQCKPFESEEMNVKLFELLLARIQDPFAHPSRVLPAIFIVTPLLKSIANRSLASQMAARFIEVLSRLMKVAKPNPRTEFQGRLRVQTILAIAQSNNILVLESLVYAAMEVFENISIDSAEMAKQQWADLSSAENDKDLTLRFLLSLFRFLIAGLTSRSGAVFQSATHSLFDCLQNTPAKVFLLSLVWGDLDSPDQLRAAAIKMASLFIEKEAKDAAWAVGFGSSVVPQLLTCLVSPSRVVREHAIALLEVLGKIKALKTTTYSGLVSELSDAGEEIKTDAEQTKIIVSTYLGKSTASKVSSTLFGLVCSTQVPGHIKHGLLKALVMVNTPVVLTSLLPLISQFTESTVDELDLAQSSVLTMLLERFTAKTATILAKDDGWEIFQKAMRMSKNILKTEEDITLSPQDILVEVLTKEFFAAVTQEKTKIDILNELLDIIVKTEKTTTARQARRALKRISFEAALLAKLLDIKSQIPAQDPTKVSEVKGRRQPREPSFKPSQSPVWSRILAVLEMFQSKKKIADVHLLIAPLFDLLKSCLDEEEQLPLEYSKQVILSCLLACCQQLSPGDSTKLASEFNTGLIVQCIRVSNNPQTHHQALLLLSLAAQLFPSHVLHNIMAIFTFMGTSVLRQDDAYSFQVIAKTLESVIPTLIEASKKTAVEPVVTTVIHVFADALPEVPEHRRIPVFDKLLTTLDPEVYLWLAPTLILSNMATQGPRLGRGVLKEEDDKDRVIPDVEFSLNVCHLYKPQVQLKACNRMLDYLHSLPVEKDDKRRPTASANKDMSEGSAPFSVEVHSTRQLCHFKLLLANFISTLLSSNRLIEQLVELDETEKPTLEPIYEKLIESSLQYTLTVSRLVDHPFKVPAQEQGPNPKFWRALLHRCHDIIDRINSLLPPLMFISVIHNLLSHKLPSIRRRAMELLGAKLQHQSNFFSLAENEKSLLELIPDLTSIARASGPGEEAALNQQTSFFTLKLLCRLLGPSACVSFKPILELVVDTISPAAKTSTNVLASAFLCLAELIQDMGVQSLPYLPRYGANLVARLEDLPNIENHDLLLLSVVIAIHKLVETLPQFLVPYLPPIIKQVCYLAAKLPTSEKQTQLQTRLQSIRHSLATASIPRTLVSSITKVYTEVTGIDSGDFKSSPSIGPLLAILSESFASMSRDELTIQLPALTSFFVQALDARSLLSARKASVDEMNTSEEPVVAALVSLVLKLSEASFRPLFYQLYDWATRVTDVHKERLVTFYNLTMQIAEKLKGLFVSFAGHFIRNAAQVIVDTNFTKKETLPFGGPNAEANTLMLLEFVLRCLYRVCLHDNENFINKERFETLMEPLVDQLENQLGDEETVKRRVREMLVPLLAQMAVAASDDYLWKALHYQLLLKTRHNTPRVRLGALNALSALVEKLGEDYLALLPEAIPFLAELLEDDVQEVETEAQATIANMENILGEPLQKYF